MFKHNLWPAIEFGEDAAKPALKSLLGIIYDLPALDKRDYRKRATGQLMDRNIRTFGPGSLGSLEMALKRGFEVVDSRDWLGKGRPNINDIGMIVFQKRWQVFGIQGLLYPAH